MWYVLQVRTGTEDKTKLLCEHRITDSNILKRCFIPYYEEKRRISGEWKTLKKLLFPGYLFVVTDNIRDFQEALKKVDGFTRLLGTGDEIIPIAAKEQKFLESFGGEEQITRMSEGIIVNSQVLVRSGPLMGKEGLIKKIDRHKRKAYLEVELFGRMQKVQVGLEIVEKR